MVASVDESDKLTKFPQNLIPKIKEAIKEINDNLNNLSVPLFKPRILLRISYLLREFFLYFLKIISLESRKSEDMFKDRIKKLNEIRSVFVPPKIEN